MSKIKILIAANEIAPFLHTSSIATSIGTLCQYMQDKADVEFRILVPRFGMINTKKNRLHEVVRLSGVNIAIGDTEQPLIIRVATVPNTRLQVYFIDNEQYFKKKTVFYEKDNEERMIFFCKGVLETAKGLNFVPDIIHCHGWMTSLIPMYVKTLYRYESSFAEAKVLFTLYNTVITQPLLAPDWIEKVGRVGEEAQALLANTDFKGLLRAGMHYADRVTQAETLPEADFKDVVGQQALTHIGSNEEGMEAYHRLYHALAGRSSL